MHVLNFVIIEEVQNILLLAIMDQIEIHFRFNCLNNLTRWLRGVFFHEGILTGIFLVKVNERGPFLFFVN
jgi:hypothetical protein